MNLSYSIGLKVILLSFLSFQISNSALANDWFEATRGEIITSKDKRVISLNEFHENSPLLKMGKGVVVRECLTKNRPCSKLERAFIFSQMIGHNTVLNLVLEKDRMVRKLTIQILPPDFPFAEQVGSSILNKSLVFSLTTVHSKPESACHLFVLSPRGEIIFYRRIPHACNDFRPHSLNGRTFYSYQLVNEGIQNVGYLGPRIILDDNFTPYKTVAAQNEGHEFILVDDDHWIGIEFELSRLKSGLVYIDKKIVERKNGSVIFSWGTSDYLKQHNTELLPNVSLTSYHNEIVLQLLHLNSVQSFRDGLLISLGTNGVVYIDRKSRKILWELGGIRDEFKLSLDQHPNFLHTPSWDPKTKTLTLFSNLSHGVPGTTFSRVLSYRLDLDAKSIAEFTVLRDKKELSLIMGSVEVHEKTLSIGFGTKDIGKYDFIEMHGSAETWKLSFGRKFSAYRFYRPLDAKP
mgnify:CR=1 FL=1